MNKRVFAIALAMLFSLLVSTDLYAQDNAAITGVAKDASGANLTGTVVTLVNPHTGIRLTTTTNSSGSYRFPLAPPGEGYVLTFAHAGFASTIVNNLSLAVGVTQTRNATLSAGANETIEVTSNDSETLNTTDASLGNNISPETLNTLPIYDRTGGITTLFYLQPGVDSASGSVTGARTDQSSVTVDGMDVNDIAAGSLFGIVANAPVDSVDQFRGTVGGLVPSIGTGSGGQFQLVTKSGTNTFHGNINEYNRTAFGESNSYFNNLNGVPRTQLTQNQFGGSLGGRIIKDKLFFFYDIAVSRIAQGASEERTVPLDSFRNNTLNYVLASTPDGTACSESSRLNTNPTCVGSLSSTQVAALDPAGIGFDVPLFTTLDAIYPHANDLTQGDGLNTGGYRFNTPTPDDSMTNVARVDYNISPKQRLFARFTIARQTAIYTPGQFPGDPATTTFTDHSYSYVASHTWEIGSNKVNQIYYGDVISKYAFPFAYNPTGANQFSFTGLTGPYGSSGTQQRRVPIPEVRDDFNWTKGSHNLTMGGTFKFIKTNSLLQSNFNNISVGLVGNELYGGLVPSVRPADINQGQTALNNYDNLFATALGVIGETGATYDFNAAGVPYAQASGASRSYRYFETELYAGDTWKITPHLTLDYGVRYQLYSVPYETHGEESLPSYSGLTSMKSTFDTYIADRVAQSNAGAAGNSSLPIISYNLGGKANHAAAMYSPSYKDFAPRVALVFNPASLPKTVFNLGAGLVYDRTVINAVNFQQDQSSYLFQSGVNQQEGSSAGVSASLATDPRIGANFAIPPNIIPGAPKITKPYVPYVDASGTPYGLAASEFNYAVDPTLKDPYNINLNLGVQQELGWHSILKISYAGRMGRRLLAQADASQLIDYPDPVSGQGMGAAFAALSLQERNTPNGGGIAPGGALTAQPWFENVMQPGIGQSFGFANNTSLAGYLFSSLGPRGDFADSIQTLALYTYYYGYPFLPTNVGMPSQIAGNNTLTSKGFSTYNALLATYDKDVSNGLRFQVNYTWSHSIDNTSLVANSNASGGYGFICDVLRPRECRGNSDFDVTNEFNGNFTYDLPFGRGKTFAGKSPRWLDEIIGGWSASSIFFIRTGQAQTVFSDAFVAGYANDAPAIYTGTKRPKVSVNKDSSGTIYQFAGGSAGATNLANSFQGPLGFTIGSRNTLRTPGYFNMDSGLAKSFPIWEKVRFTLRADMFNALNHTSFSGGGLNIVNNSPFGQITGTQNGTRVTQFSGRIEF